MPIYQHECPNCKDSQGREKIHDFFRPMSQAGDIEVCPDCKSETKRIYSFSREKEFFSYEDEQYKTNISSKSEEKRLMKMHGHVDTRETPFYEKWKHHTKIARRKPVYFIPGVKQSKMDRD